MYVLCLVLCVVAGVGGNAAGKRSLIMFMFSSEIVAMGMLCRCDIAFL